MQWNANFKRKNNKEATNKERSILANDLYQNYRTLSNCYNEGCMKMEHILKVLQLEYDELEALCQFKNDSLDSSNPFSSPTNSPNTNSQSSNDAIEKVMRIPKPLVIELIKDA
jgi:hypothetical protein